MRQDDIARLVERADGTESFHTIWIAFVMYRCRANKQSASPVRV